MAVLGSVVGTGALLLLCAAGCFCWRRRAREAQRKLVVAQLASPGQGRSGGQQQREGGWRLSPLQQLQLEQQQLQQLQQQNQLLMLQQLQQLQQQEQQLRRSPQLQLLQDEGEGEEALVQRRAVSSLRGLLAGEDYSVPGGAGYFKQPSPLSSVRFGRQA